MVTENTEQLLSHVGRYRVTTIDAVFSLYYQDGTREAARKALYRLCEEEYLARFEIRNRSFYQLTKKGCIEIGAPKNAGQPFSAQALFERYAMLAFCSLREGNRRRITTEELHALFPELAQDKFVDPSAQHYYADFDGKVYRLGRVTVDNGGEVYSLVEKCQGIAAKSRKSRLERLISEQSFVLTVLTPHRTKGVSITQALEKQRLIIPISVEVIPELLHLGG